MGRIYSTSRRRRKRSESNYQILPSKIGHDPYGADKNALAQLNAEIARLEIEEAVLNSDFNSHLKIEEFLEKHFQELQDHTVLFDPLIFRNLLSDVVLDFIWHIVVGIPDVLYYKRQADISSYKNILLKLRDSLRSKISRAFVVPNIRNTLQKKLKPLFRRCVGEEPIELFTYENKINNLIVFNHENQKRIYKNYRLAS